jgi:hypothetical protein
MGILAIIQSVLEALIGFFKWQTVLAQINARKLVYDIDQEQLQKGRDLISRIDAARNANDLSALSLHLDDQANAALYAARIRSAIPDDGGRINLGVGSGISTAPAPDSSIDYGVKPATGTEPSAAVGPIPALPPTHIIPKVPFAVTGAATWWGLNPNGSNDTGDVDEHGKNLLGAFGDDNHNEQIVGGSIPVEVFHATVGKGAPIYKSVADRKYKLDVLSHSTGKHLTGVWLTDLGPAARLHRPLDLTYAANKLLEHTDGTNICTWWLTGPEGIMEVKGWDFVKGQVS